MHLKEERRVVHSNRLSVVRFAVQAMQHLPNIKMDGQIAVIAVAAKGSFERAGRYLGIGKSAVRKRVQSVEDELGTPAFRDLGKRMAPTKAGHLYLQSARESVRQAGTRSGSGSSSG